MIEYLRCKTFYKIHSYPFNTLVKTWLLFITFKADRRGRKFGIFDIGDPASPSSCGLSLPLSCDLPPVVGQPPPRQQPAAEPSDWENCAQKACNGKFNIFSRLQGRDFDINQRKGRGWWWMVEFKVFKGGLEHLRQLSRSKVNVVCGYVRWQRPTAPPTNDNKY